MKLLLALALVGSATAFVTCNNGNLCQDNEQCTTQKLNTGAKWGCAPATNVVCKDPRFSAPTLEACGDDAMRTNSTNAKYVKTSNDANDGVCDIVGGDLPSFCECDATASSGGKLACTVDFAGLDKIGAAVDVEPCGTGSDNGLFDDDKSKQDDDAPAPGPSDASIALEITEADLGIDYKMGPYGAGKSASIPVPGLSIDAGIGSIGVMMDVGIDGNAGALKLNVAVDGCVSVVIVGKECGSSIPGLGLPISILSETYDFSDICSRR
eukprot:g2821.t1